MKIVVAYKWAPNPQDASVCADGQVDWSRAKAGVSEYDPVAIETGRQLADAASGELVGLTVGSPEADASLARKTALARGLDRLVTVTDAALADADALTTATALAAAVRRIGDVDVVLTGDSSVDVGAKLVPSVLAGLLGWPVLSEVSSVTAREGGLTVERELAGGIEVLAVDGPAVLAMASNAVTPRIPGMKDTLAAAKKPVEALGATEAEIPAATAHLTGASRPPVKERARNILSGDAADTATRLAAALRDAQAI